jgi:hypothetical protein
MITPWNPRKNHTHLSAFAYPGADTPPQSAKMICWQAHSVNHQLLTVGCNSKRIPFFD